MALVAHLPLYSNFENFGKNKATVTTNIHSGSFTTISDRRGVEFNANNKNFITIEDNYRYTPRGVSMWIYIDSVALQTRANFIFSCTNIEVMELHTNTDGGLRFLLSRMSDGTGAVPSNLYFDTQANTIVPGRWCHIIVSTKYRSHLNIEEVCINVDGKLVLRKEFASKDWVSLETDTIHIGQRQTSPNYYFQGLISDVCVFNNYISEKNKFTLYSKNQLESFEDDIICEYYLDKQLTDIHDREYPIVPVQTTFNEDEEIGNFFVVNYHKFAVVRDIENFLRHKKFSISFWVKVKKHNDGINCRESILSFSPGVSGSFHILITDHSIHIGAWNAGICNGPIYYMPYDEIRDIMEEWTHFSCVIDNISKQMKIYINSSIHDTSNFDNSEWMINDKALELRVGGNLAYVNGNSGTMPTRNICIKHIIITNDEVDFKYINKISKFRYMGGELIAHYPFNYNSENNTKYPFTLATQTYSSDSVVGGSLVCPVPYATAAISRGRYLLSLIEREFTITFWYKETKDVTDKVNPIFGFNQHGGAQHRYGIVILYDKECLFVKLHFNDQSKVDVKVLRDANDFKIWKHFAITFSGCTLKIYIDGKLAHVEYYSVLKRISWLDIESICIGATKLEQYTNESESYLLNDFRVYNKVLDLESIGNIAMANILDFKVKSTSEYIRDVIGPHEYDNGPQEELRSMPGHENALFPIHGWSSGLNKGVENYQKGFSAYWLRYEGLMTLVFKNKNSSIGLPNRWMGVACEFTNYNLRKSETITISFEMMEFEDVRHVTRVGLYHYIEGSNERTFYSGHYDLRCDNTNTWEKKEVTFDLRADYDELRNCALYIYGNHGNEGVSYIRKIQVTRGDHSVEYTGKTSVGETYSNLIHSNELSVDSSGYTKRGTAHKRMNGTIYVDDNESNTRFNLLLSGDKKFKPLRRYTVSVDIYDLSWKDESNKASNTFRFQVQYYRGPNQASNNVIWSEHPDYPNLMSMNGWVNKIKLTDGWTRIIFTFSFVPPLTDNSTHTYSSLYYQGGADYEAYTRTYYIRNFKLMEGVGDPNNINQSLEDNSIYRNHGETDNYNSLVKNNYIELNSRNHTVFDRLKFSNLSPTSSFSHYIKFMAYPNTEYRTFHFLGYSFGSQIDGICITQNGTIGFNTYKYSGSSEKFINLNCNVKFNVWNELLLTYDNISKEMRVNLNGVWTDATYVDLIAFNSASSLFGTNCGSAIGNHPGRVFDGRIKRIAVFGRVISYENLCEFLSEKIQIKTNHILTNKRVDEIYFKPNNISIVNLIGYSKFYIQENLFTVVPEYNPLNTSSINFRIRLSREPFEIQQNIDSSSKFKVTLEIISHANWSNDIYISDVNDSANFTYKVDGKFIHVYIPVNNFSDVYCFIDFRMKGGSLSPITIRVYDFIYSNTDVCIETKIKHTYRNTNMLRYDYLPHGIRYDSNFWMVSHDKHANLNLLEMNQNGEYDLMLGNTISNDSWDGGFDVYNLQGHSSNRYRFSILLRRPVNLTGNEYLGTNTRNASILDSRGETGNLYFAWPTSGIINGVGIGNDWHLLVFYVVRSNDEFKYTGDHGIYKVHSDDNLVPVSKSLSEGLYVGEGNMRFRNLSEFVSFHCRSYLFYSKRNDDTCRFYRPRVDVCDGTEPSIAELIMGLDTEIMSAGENNYTVTGKSAFINKNTGLLEANNILKMIK